MFGHRMLWLALDGHLVFLFRLLAYKPSCLAVYSWFNILLLSGSDTSELLVTQKCNCRRLINFLRVFYIAIELLE